VRDEHCNFHKVVQTHYLFRWGGKRLYHFAENLFTTLRTKFLQNWPSFMYDINSFSADVDKSRHLGVECCYLGIMSIKVDTHSKRYAAKPVYIHIQHWEQSTKNLFSTEKVKETFWSLFFFWTRCVTYSTIDLRSWITQTHQLCIKKEEISEQ